jgi:hypothetical protein
MRSHVPAETRARLKAGAAQNGRRRGTAARAAHRAAGPRPWRAWVRPAGARAHLHLHQHIHGTKAGFTAARDTAKRARLTSGLAARHALGAAHDGAAPDGATRGVPPAHLQKHQEPHRNGDSTGGVTAWGSLDPRLPLTRRDAASPMGRRRRARSDRGGSKARTQAVRLRRPAQGEEREGHGAHCGSAV